MILVTRIDPSCLRRPSMVGEKDVMRMKTNIELVLGCRLEMVER